MELRKKRMSKKYTVSELSQLTRIEADVIRQYEYKDTIISKNHLKRFELVFEQPKIFYGMGEFETKMYVEFVLNDYKKVWA